MDDIDKNIKLIQDFFMGLETRQAKLEDDFKKLVSITENLTKSLGELNAAMLRYLEKR